VELKEEIKNINQSLKILTRIVEEIQEQGISRHEFRLEEAITRPVFEPPTPQPIKPSVSNT